MKRKILIFIHGLGGEPKKTWDIFQELICSDPDIIQPMIVHYSFPSGILSWPFSRGRPNIGILADGLSTQINALAKDDEEIVLVCHSLGGLIAKQYILNSITEKRCMNISHVLFFATPHSGSHLADIAQYVSWKNPQIRNLCKNSDIIVNIQRNWFNADFPDSMKFRYIIAAQDKVVSIESARMYWGNRDVDVLVEKDHISVVKPTGRDDLCYSILKKAIVSSSKNNYSSKNLEVQSPPANKEVFSSAREIRVSVSSLLRIERMGRFLLVRGRHRPETFGPLGGVLKVYPAARTMLSRLGFRFENVDDGDMLNDLRGYISAERFHVFLDWLESEVDRESAVDCLRREISEEFVEVGQAPPLDLIAAQLTVTRIVTEGPEFVSMINRHQYRKFSILEPVLNENYTGIVNFIWNTTKDSEDLVWCNANEIRRGRGERNILIGSHSEFLLDDKRYRGHDPPFLGQE